MEIAAIVQPVTLTRGPFNRPRTIAYPAELGNNGGAMTGAEFAHNVERAHRRIRGDIVRTPLLPSALLSRSTGADVRIKWECEQTTGSFKLRGAFNAVRALSPARRRSGIVSASTGNHGLAMIRVARITGAPLELYVPDTITAIKKRKLRRGGARLIVRGATCEQSEIIARAAAAARGRTFISPYNDWNVVFGQGTIGLEINQDAPDADVVLVPVGGGGLAAGIAGYLRSRSRPIEIWGVEPVRSAFMKAAFAAGRLVEIVERPTLADAVAGGLEPGAITFGLCRKYLDGIIAVGESTLRSALRTLIGLRGGPVEGAGALALAGLMTERERFRGRRIILIVSGRNGESGFHR
jgi:threonine dehydratase